MEHNHNIKNDIQAEIVDAEIKPANIDKKKYKEQSYVCIVGLIVALLLIIGSSVFPFILKREKNSTAKPTVGTSTPENTVVPSPDNDGNNLNTETNSQHSDFILINSEKPSKQSYTLKTISNEAGVAYWDESKEIFQKYMTDENKVPDKVSAVGNYIYKVPADVLLAHDYENLLTDDASETGYAEVQFYGYSPAPAYGPAQFVAPRQQKTGKRIHVFDAQVSKENFVDNWNKGQSFLQGTETPPNGTIVLDGMYLEGVGFKKINNEYYVPLYLIAQRLVPELPPSIYNKVLDFMTPTLNGCDSITVPVSDISIGSPFAPTFEARVNYDNSNPETDTFTSGAGTKCYVPASELSRYTGWKIYTNNHFVSIITDELNCSNLAVVKDLNESGYSGEDTTVRYTDPGDILSEQEAEFTPQEGD